MQGANEPPQRGWSSHQPQPMYPQYAIGAAQFGSTPPQRGRMWPWIVGVVAVVAVLIAVGGFFAGRALLLGRKHTYTLVFEVGGSAAAANVLVILPDQETSAADEGDGPKVTLPWRQELTVKARGNYAFVRFQAIASGPKGEVTCRLTSNGQIVDEDVDGGGYASCSGDANVSPGDWTPEPTTPSSTPSGPPPHSDIIPELALPVGSVTAPGTREGERWEMPVPYPQAVEEIRQQLPVGRDYQGLRWCDEHVEDELTMWAWGDKNDLLYVMVDGKVRTGSAVTIKRAAPSPTGC